MGYYLSFDRAGWKLHRPDGRVCANLDTTDQHDLGAAMREAADILGIDDEGQIQPSPPYNPSGHDMM